MYVRYFTGCLNVCYDKHSQICEAVHDSACNHLPGHPTGCLKLICFAILTIMLSSVKPIQASRMITSVACILTMGNVLPNLQDTVLSSCVGLQAVAWSAGNTCI